MKKILFSIAFAIISAAALAVPAKPGFMRFTQPDGSTVMARLVGDEFGHALVDASGNVLVRTSDGYLRPSAGTKAALAMRSSLVAQKRAAANSARAKKLATRSMSSGTRHIPVILVEFSDVKFRTANTATAFQNLLDQPGYGESGSVRDFYVDNSHGVFTPEFDVYGPVTLTKPMKTYGANDPVTEDDVAPELALYEAAKQLDNSVDFSKYDTDGDGEVDMILMYYAGYSEAEYGPEDSIWPHQWSVVYSDNATIKRGNSFDGVKLGNYFCGSELATTRVNSNYVATDGVFVGPGTTCHEFAHSLGLPDYYDTNYEDDGTAGGTYNYDTMCGGSYNNDGNTPPYFTAEERIMLGWMESYSDLPSFGQVSIPALSSTSSVAFKGPSTNDGEYFVFECRGNSGWDSGIEEGPGLVVYHADKSKTTSVKIDGQTYTPYALHANNYQINDNGSHPCFYLIPAGCQNYKADNTKTEYGYGGTPSATTGLNYEGNEYTFGTSAKFSSYTPVDWSKATLDYTLSDISYSGGVVTFSLGEICYIAEPTSCTAGATFPLQVEGLPDSATVAWFYDDTPVTGTSLTLTSGTHVVEARISHLSRTTRLEMELTVD